ncbi:uncharacterized protein LOC117915339 isoform X1 [Vitis riparia]|uniref:uncharacterized protein LOC117915339 isoform X1 n=1 Tax=Vitis riparia TaxID=96939 RepID=UPI00155A63CA|nr:uncharacterized protein LOC117915339 isoform X1 [Vitis riparia]XP_034686783.1 uncharacterized protein LOC117915339 isoform X1 [Vitis riparia]
MLAQGGVAFTSAAGKGKKDGWTRKGVDRTYLEKPIELHSEWEFREQFRIPNDISIRLMNSGPVPTEKESHNVVVFSKEQFNVRLHFPLLSLFRQFLHFTKFPPVFLHLNAIRVLMGSSILDVLFHLDLSLLKVIFIYNVKMSEKGIFILSAHILSLQLVMGLPNSTKDATKGHVIVSGPWAGLLEHPSREFKPCHSLEIPEKNKRIRLVEWVEKAFFDWLNKLFVISASEWHYQTMLTDRNLLAVVQESQSYVLPILPRLTPKVLVPGEHHILKDLPFYEEVRVADTKARQD